MFLKIFKVLDVIVAVTFLRLYFMLSLMISVIFCFVVVLDFVHGVIYKLSISYPESSP